MQQLDKMIEALNQDVLNGTGKKTSELFLIGCVIVLVALATFLVTILIFGSTALLLQSYVSDRIIFQDSIFNFMGINRGIAEFRCHCLWALGFSLFAVSPMISVATQGKFKQTQYKYLPLVLGCVLLISSTILSAVMNFIPFYSYEYLGQAIAFISGIGIGFTFLEEKYSHLSTPFSLIVLAGLLIRELGR